MNSKLLDPPRWPAGPPICLVANLPAFESEKAAQAFNDAHGHLPMLVRWQCKACGGWHHWTTAKSDSNGRMKAGADEAPHRIRRMAL